MHQSYDSKVVLFHQFTLDVVFLNTSISLNTATETLAEWGCQGGPGGLNDVIGRHFWATGDSLETRSEHARSASGNTTGNLLDDWRRTRNALVARQETRQETFAAARFEGVI
ncbi:hypothetical protein NDU88_006895 [Pleurodeles waltl]|uniref:MHC class I antigen n=1 Tax=Pleurodeles waltl TaxID=8319 RepID=A0AAV7LRZ7_PLEWA|nr:hypothetical protein NDU88_006895 [Pleurodeles waltl]